MGDGGTTTVTTTAIIANAPPVVSIANPIIDIDEGQNGNRVSFSIGVSDAGAADTAMMVTWDFGDGTTASGLGMLTTTHDYADSGVYRVIVTAADKDGGTGTNTFDVSIDNLAPSNLTIICACTPSTPAPEDASVEFSGSVRDWNGLLRGAVDVEALSAQMDFGDGAILPSSFKENGKQSPTIVAPRRRTSILRRGA